jgi:hypothetical protein
MEFLIATSSGLLGLLLKVFVIVVPLMIILEVSREFGALHWLTAAAFPLARHMGFKRDSIYPLIAGIIFGISYGGGVLISESNSGRIGANQIFLIALFLGMCHAIFEDTLLFVSLGANGFIIVIARSVLAIVVVSIVALFFKEKHDQQT